MKKLLLFILLIPSILLHAQVNSGRQNITINIQPTAIETTPEFRSLILPAMAQGNGHPNDPTRIILQFALLVTHEQTSGGIRVTASLQDFRTSGEVIYRGFSLGDLLIPEQVNLNILSLESNGALISRTYTTDLNRSNQYRIGYSIPWTFAYPTQLGFRAEYPVLVYPPQQILAIQTRMQQINDYYAVAMLLDEALGKVNYLPPMSPDNMDIQSAGLQEAEQTLQLIKNKNFRNGILADGGDPAGIFGKTAQLENILNAKRSQINVFYSALDAYYYNKGLEMVAAKKWLDAERMFNKSLSVNPGFAPSTFEIAQIKLNSDDPVAAESLARSIWFTMRPDPSIYQKTGYLFRDIFSEYIDKADQASAAGNTEAETAWLEKAEALCREVQGIPCGAGLASRRKRASEKQFNQLIAGAFANLKSNFETSKSIYSKAGEINRNELNSSRNATLDSLRFAIENTEMENIIVAGENALAARNESEAHAKAEAAVTKMEQLRITPGDRTRNRIANLALLQMRTDALTLVKKIKDNGGSNAEQMLAPFKSEQKRFYLDDNAELEQILEPVQSIIRDKECQKVKADVEKMIKNARESRDSKNFLAAEEWWQEVINTAEQKPYCQIQAARAADERMQIIAPATFQKLINQIIHSQVKSSCPPDIEQQYKKAEAYYYEQTLDQFGLTIKPFKTFAIDNFRVSSLQIIAEGYRKQGKLEESMEFYKLALSRGGDPSFMRDGLYELGRAFGTRDKNAGTDAKQAREKVEKYIEGNSALKRFKKGYQSVY